MSQTLSNISIRTKKMLFCKTLWTGNGMSTKFIYRLMQKRKYLFLEPFFSPTPTGDPNRSTGTTSPTQLPDGAWRSRGGYRSSWSQRPIFKWIPLFKKLPLWWFDFLYWISSVIKFLSWLIAYAHLCCSTSFSNDMDLSQIPGQVNICSSMCSFNISTLTKSF